MDHRIFIDLIISILIVTAITQTGVLRADFLTILIPSSSLGKSDETKDSAVASAPSPP